jgi:putative transposase
MRGTVTEKATRRARSRAKPGSQLRLGLKRKFAHGGERKNAGRKSRTGLSPVARTKRPVLGENHAVHANWRVLPHAWNMRSRRGFRVVLRAFAASSQRFGMRITHFSVMGNHVHVIVEADGTEALTRGMQGLAIRLAKGFNRLMGRSGPVFADRYFARPLSNPTEARNAIDYVMNNARIHARRKGRELPPGDDEYAVGPKQLRAPHALWRRLTRGGPPPVAEAAGWLLREGWMLARTRGATA